LSPILLAKDFKSFWFLCLYSYQWAHTSTGGLFVPGYRPPSGQCFSI